MEHPDSTSPPQASPGNLIRSARETLLLSQEQLAKGAGVSVSTIARLEKGNPVSGESLKAVCAVLGLDAVTVNRETIASPDIARSVPERAYAGGQASPQGRTPRRHALAALVYAVPLLLVTFLLCILAAEVGTQTSAAVLAGRTDLDHKGLLSVAVLVVGGEVNQASVVYSAALPPDHPSRAWKPWKRMKPVTWLSCGPPSFVGRALGRFLPGIPEDSGPCRDEGLPMRMTRRDDVRTDFVLGPSTGPDLSRLLSMLTADPSVSIQAFASPMGDVPPDDAAWHDPRIDGYQGGMAGGKGWYVHLRLSRAAS